LLSSEGKMQEALAECRQALAEFERLHAEFPDNRLYRGNLEAALVQLFALGQDTISLDDLESLCRRALVHCKVMLAQDGSQDSRAALAGCYNNLATVAMRRRDYAAAEVLLKQALELKEQLVEEAPKEPQYRQDVAATLGNIAEIQQATNRLADAETNHQRGLAILERLITEYPGAPLYRQEAAKSALRLANVLIKRVKPEATVAAYDRAIAAVSTKAPPGIFQEVFASYARQARMDRARALTFLKRYAESLAEWDRIIDVEPPASRPEYQLGRAVTLAHSGEHAAAAKIARQIAAEASVSPGRYVACADVFAVASAVVQDDPELREGYVKQAVEMLRLSAAVGFRNTMHMERDANFNPLRHRDDFKTVVAEIAKNAELPRAK